MTVYTEFVQYVGALAYNQKDLQAAQKFRLRVVSPKEFLQIVGEIP
ncbi:hypothetical protein LC653_26685 [Nostoc sp. CHAB 5784]|nr:hypothetical protein [Nostoc mirabile CHAB5784]